MSKFKESVKPNDTMSTPDIFNNNPNENGLYDDGVVTNWLNPYVTRYSTTTTTSRTTTTTVFLRTKSTTSKFIAAILDYETDR